MLPSPSDHCSGSESAAGKVTDQYAQWTPVGSFHFPYLSASLAVTWSG